jgi:hypothetical protein
METNIIGDIWKELNENLSFIIVLIVIATGYMVRWAKILTKWNTTLKLALFSMATSITYMFISDKVDWSIWFASYFCAFGMHTVIIRWFEDKTGLKNKINRVDNPNPNHEEH